MKIAFVGKGGSGKTTLSALFCRYLASKQLPVLALDADINQHLGSVLGFDDKQLKNQPGLGLEISRVKKYLRGQNGLFAAADMIKTTPPGKGSVLLKVGESSSIYDYFELKRGSLTLMSVGEFGEEDLGIKCYHSKTGAVELILNHLADKAGEYVVADLTAGADTFASGMFTRFDLTCVVVEPTVQSLAVYDQYKKYSLGWGVKLAAVANKIDDQSDIDFITNHIQTEVMSCMYSSTYIKRLERGEVSTFSQLGTRGLLALDNIKTRLDSCKKNWPLYFEQAVLFHEKNAVSWANAQSGKNLGLQVDRGFSYPEI